ncbi:dynein regulatory complex subunit 3 [Synchiropus splendidus]|uniref:dynein regulatory complex subunit 3 n=1 Tax=Synchiropus splendidus TaxID=270530 RepID=UPI00237EAA0C|nr:dynein regulatory complex subunit 3 [Synchiropus splendidus]
MDRFCHEEAEFILMDENILRMAVAEQNSKDKTRRASKIEGIHFEEVLQLHVEYKDILNIDNLWGFTSLTKLELNNNCIAKIEGLDGLVHLQWLNLSFNKIEKLEGLHRLHKLEFLNLTSNRISVIENMNCLEELKLFSIAHNCIDQVETILHLRKLKNLRTLNVFGNPLLMECDYKLFIAAHFPNLMYLDYRVLTQEAKAEGAMKYLISIEKIKSQERLVEVERRQEAELQLHKDAFVEFLSDSQLFNEMFRDDPEVDKIRNIPGVVTVVETFGKEVVELCCQIFKLGLAEHQKRDEEVKLFFRIQTETENQYQQKAAGILGEFELQQQKMTSEIQQTSDSEIQKVKLESSNHQINVLQKELTALEFEMSSQLESNAKRFDNNMTDMVSNFSETVQGIFAQCRDLENNYYKQVQEVAVAAIEAAAQDALEDIVLDDFREIFLDKEILIDVLATSHDNHLTKINDRESELVTRLNAWKGTLIKKIQEDAQRWNSTRISDIERYVDYLRKQADAIYNLS